VPNILQAQKLFWMHTMEPLGDVGQVKSCFGPFEDCVNISPFGDTR
jgi:hypothetical protein